MTDQFLPTGLMLISAVLVALVGVLLKRSDNKLVFRAVLTLWSAILVFPLIFILPLPPSQAWPFLVGGALAHFFYQLAYVGAFQRGDMSVVYPIMRGVSPALAAVFAYAVLSESLNGLEIIGLAIVVAALMGFGWPEHDKNRHSSAIILALICGAFIAVYSVIDAAGMRVSKTLLEQGWTYIVWFFVLDAFGTPTLVAWRRRGRVLAEIKPQLRWGFFAGVLSLFSFSLALYAFTLAPVAKMSAMRETSVVFGAIFAAALLKEPFGRRRILLAIILAFGLMLMQMA